MERVNPRPGPYTQRELLPLLRVKPHVLRYWEQTLPLIRSRRDDTGRRIWSAGQVRMLLRVRHLVVERGVSVTAAGDALLREAGGESARLKGGLERVRNALVVLLLKVQSRRNAPGVRPIPTEGPAAGQKAVPAGEHDGAYEGIRIESLMDQGLIPPAPGGDASVPRIPLVSGPVRERQVCFPFADRELDAGETTTAGTATRLVYSHLFVRGDPASVAAATAALVRYRLKHEVSGGEGVPLVVAAPREHCPVYRKWFSSPALVLPVTDPVLADMRYTAPTLSVMVALAFSRELDQYMRENNSDTILTWAADNPHSPAVDHLSEWARHVPGGVVLGVRRIPGGYRMNESAGIDLSRWRPRFEETVQCGRWFPERWGGTGTRWVYRLWLRDLARLGAPGMVLSHAPGPSVWRGSSWFEQVKLVWPWIRAEMEFGAE